MIEKKDLIVLESEVSRMKSDFQGVPLTTKTRKRTKVEYREKMGFIVYFRGRAMKRVARISKGMAFGGMSLSEKNKNGRRTATILAEEDTYCLVLDRDSYLNIIGKIRAKKLEKVIQGYSQFPLFKGGPNSFYQILMIYAKSFTVPYSKTLIDFKQKVKGIYIMRSGTVKVKKK